MNTERTFIEIVRWILSIAILIHAIGLFSTVFGMRQTHFGNYLFMVMGMAHADAVFYERISVSVFLLICLVNLVHTRFYTLLPITLYIFFEAWAGYYQAGYRYSEFTLFAHVLRYTTPAALLFLCAWPLKDILKQKIRLFTTQWILRISLAVLFFIHGLEAWYGYPVFIDLIIGSANNLPGIRVSEITAVRAMKVIGVIDFIVALLLLIKPWKAVLFWACFWSTITAFSRVTAVGATAYIEVLFRASHIIVPIAVWMLLYRPAFISEPIFSGKANKNHNTVTEPI